MNSLSENYLEILKQSLNKKIEVLDAIIALNRRQADELKDPQLEADTFEKTVEEKGKLIEKLDLLDSGFEKVYANVKEELDSNREAHRDEILHLQQLIREITEKSNQIQTQEIRNRELAVTKFSSVRQQIREVRTSHKVAAEYYKNMLKLNYVDSQFLDRKK